MAEEQWKPKNNYGEETIISKIKHLLTLFLPVITFILIIIIGAATVFLRTQISTMNDNLIYLNKIVSNIDTASLKSEMTAIETKIGAVSKENEKLKSELARLESVIESIKAKKEKADVNKNPGKNTRTR
jgi:septal ring factor EnvC (AmiA/AmiB activator)